MGTRIVLTGIEWYIYIDRGANNILVQHRTHIVPLRVANPSIATSLVLL